MDEILWCMRWSAALAPELAMIPDRSVFLRSPMGRSLTDTTAGMPGDIWEAWEHADDTNSVSDAMNAGNADAVDNMDGADDVNDVDDVGVVVEICCCTTHEPGLTNKVSPDLGLFV